MGLKESGLRGSLRSTSSVLPAFFDVTITNTNSPVQEGDILMVDYSADNTGDGQDTQDIRLEIDSVEEDRDSDITLLGAQSTTGTLEWDTTDEAEAEYTATVLSDDDSDSVTVEIEDAIPDSGLLHDYDAQSIDADDGDSITLWQDSHGSNDLSGGSPTFDESAINGHPALDWDGVDDSLSGNIFDHGSDILTYSFHVVYDYADTGDDNFIFATGDGDGINFRVDSSDEISVGISGIGSDNSGVASPNEPTVVSIKSDGNDHYLLVNGTDHGTFDRRSDQDEPTNSSFVGSDWDSDRNWDDLIGRILWYEVEQTDEDFNDTHETLLDQFSING